MPKNEEWVAKRGDLKRVSGVKRLSVGEIIKQSDAVLVETDVGI